MTEMEDHIKITNATMKQDSWEVDRGDFVIDPHNKLGEGAFGEVYMGTVCGPYLQSNQSLPSAIRMAVNVPVAIKVLKCMFINVWSSTDIRSAFTYLVPFIIYSEDLEYTFMSLNFA